MRAFYNCFYLFSKRFTILFLVLFWLKILQKISNWFDSKLKHNFYSLLKTQKIMANINYLAEISEILCNRFGEKVMIALVTNLSIENLAKLAASL